MSTVSASPVEGFSQCHRGILDGLQALRELPELQQAAQRARQVAQQTLKLLDHAVMEHHADEERELFEAVLRSAHAGTERDRVQQLVTQLTQEHREIEALWKRMRPAVQQAATARDGELRQDAVDLLVQAYRGHARLEEESFLPLAREILGRDGNHMAALGLSLHMRHVQVPAGYV